MLHSRQQLDKRENGGTVERCQKPLLQLESNDDDNNDELNKVVIINYSVRNLLIVFYNCVITYIFAVSINSL